MPVKYYLVVDIGCIECGEKSQLLDWSTDKEMMEKVLQVAEDRQAANWTGQHSFQLWEMETR